MESRKAAADDGLPTRGEAHSTGENYRKAPRELGAEARVDLAPNALRLVFDLHVAAKLLRQTAFNKPGAKALAPRRNDGGTVLFRPLQSQAKSILFVQRLPGYADPPFFVESAPHSAALVASSCSAMLIDSAILAESHTAGPLTSNRLEPAPRYGMIAWVTISPRLAPSQLSLVKMSCVRDSASSRD